MFPLDSCLWTSGLETLNALMDGVMRRLRTRGAFSSSSVTRSGTPRAVLVGSSRQTKMAAPLVKAVLGCSDLTLSVRSAVLRFPG